MTCRALWVLAASLLLFLAVLLTACAAPRDQVVLLEVTDPGGMVTVQHAAGRPSPWPRRTRRRRRGPAGAWRPA